MPPADPATFPGMETRPYIAYYRVSTDRQGRSGLGLEAQQQAVRSFLQGRGELVASFVEVESGKRKGAALLKRRDPIF
jgi:DNA invertase Pin-like site-specific DNA recombinase